LGRDALFTPGWDKAARSKAFHVGAKLPQELGVAQFGVRGLVCRGIGGLARFVELLGGWGRRHASPANNSATPQ